jgi:hypothetical protein
MQKFFEKKIVLILLPIFSALLIYSIGSSFQTTNLQNTAKYKNVAKGKIPTFNITPNYKYSIDPEDKIQLTDGIYTSGYFWTQKTTVGWEGKRPIIIIIDLGKVEPISGVSYNTAAGIAGVTWPASIDVLVSDDGSKYFSVGELVSLSDKRELPSEKKEYAVHRYWINSLTTHGRYVQLVVNPGGPYCFVDEIEIYRGEDQWLAQKLVGEPTIGGVDFYQTNILNKEIKSRLFADLKDTKKDMEDSSFGGKDRSILLAELKDVENNIPKLTPIDSKSFSIILPINDLQARIFSLRAKIRRLNGLPLIETWASHPLDYIKPTQASDSKSKKKIDLALMRSEWRSAVFNLTNSSFSPTEIQFSINGLPGGNNPGYISVYEVQWTCDKELEPIAAALKEMKQTKPGYTTIIPPGMTRQIWLTFHPVDVTPGDYQGKITLMKSGNNKWAIPVKFRLFPFTFPSTPTLHVGGWDYTDSDTKYGLTVKNRDALISHLQERFVDSPWATSKVFPFGNFDSTGNFIQKPDTSQFDAWIARWPNARRYYVFLNVGDSIDGSKMDSELFAIKVKSWIDYWVKHAISKGIRPEQLFLLLLDEPYKNDMDRIIISWARAIHAAQPKVILWEDPTYLKPEDALTDMMSSVDVLCPNRTQLLSEGNHFIDFYRNQKSAGRKLALYSCKGPMLLQDPYSYIRLQAWSCWDMGAESTFFWSFIDTGGGETWHYIFPGPNYTPMFISSDSVTPGKHMEALRESVEDFEYFVMLKEAIANANPGNPALPKAKDLLKSGARRVLDAENADKLNWSDDKDRWIAEKVRLEILETLVALEYSGHN